MMSGWWVRCKHGKGPKGLWAGTRTFRVSKHPVHMGSREGGLIPHFSLCLIEKVY
jgi:hypothetical protein